MIKVTLFKTNGRVASVRCVGHSGLGEHGNDVLCAAVSALVQTAYLALKDICDDVGHTSRSGYFEFDVPGGEHEHDADVIIRAMCVGLRDLSSGYPQNLSLEEA